MAGTLGTIRGQIALDVKSALAGYVALRAANAATVYALSRSSAAFIATGKAMVGAGFVVAAGFGVAIKAAADFERQLDFFGAVTNSTEAQMEAVRKKAIQLGQDTIFSAGQIADSFVELGKAGVSANQIIDGVGDAVAHLGAAADIPLDRAAQIMTSAVQTFSLSAKDAVHVADLLTGAANASIVEVEDLGVSLKYVGGVAAAISLPIGDVIDALSLLGKYGIRGSTAGTSLRQILVSLSGTSKKASVELKKLGIITKDGSNQFFTAKGQAKPLAQIFQVLEDHTKGLTEAQRLAAFKIIFNNRALAAASVLSRQGAKGFAAMNKEISKTTAADVSAKRLDNLSGDIEILRGNLETLFIQAGTPFQEFLRGIVQGVTRLVQLWGNLSADTQTNILKIVAAFAGFMIIMGGVNLFIGLVLKFANHLLLLWDALKLVGGALKAVGLAFKALGVAMASNPFGLIVIAIIALVVLFVILYKKSETFRNAVNRLVASFLEGWHQIVNFFKGLPAFFSRAWTAIRNGFTSGWDSIVTFFTVTIPGWFTSMVNTITTTITGWWNGFIAFWVALPGVLGNAALAAVNAVVSFFAQLPYRIGFIIGFMIGLAIRLYVQLYTFLVQTTINIYNGIVNWFALLPGRIMAFFTMLWTGSVALWNTLQANLIRITAAIYIGVVNWFAALPGRVLAFLTSLWARAVALWNSLRATVVAAAGALYRGVINFFAQLPGRVAQFFQNLVTRSIAIFHNMVSTAGRIAHEIVSAITGGIEALPDLVGGIFDRVLGAFHDMVSRAFDAARDFAGGLWDGFKKGLGINSPSFIEKQMVQITKVVHEETNQLRGQVKAVQTLGNRLTKIPTLEPVDQTMVTNLAKTAAKQAADKLAQLQSMQRDLQRTASDITAPIALRSDLALSANAPRPSVIVQSPTNQNQSSRLIQGELSLDESGRAFISGIAQDVVSGEAQFQATVGRMG